MYMHAHVCMHAHDSGRSSLDSATRYTRQVKWTRNWKNMVNSV